jgi:hypothetical protein
MHNIFLCEHFIEKDTFMFQPFGFLNACFVSFYFDEIAIFCGKYIFFFFIVTPGMIEYSFGMSFFALELAYNYTGVLIQPIFL